MMRVSTAGAPRNRVIQNPFELSAAVEKRSRIVDAMLRSDFLVFERELAAFACFKLLDAPAAIGDHASLSLLARRVDEDHGIAKVMPSCFEQNRGIKDDGVGAARAADGVYLMFKCLSNSRMRYPFQIPQSLPALWGIAEDFAAKRRAVDGSVRIENIRSETFTDLVLDVRITEDLVAGGIAVDHHDAAPVREFAGDRTLSGSDAADEGEDGDRRLCSRRTLERLNREDFLTMQQTAVSAWTARLIRGASSSQRGTKGMPSVQSCANREPLSIRSRRAFFDFSNPDHEKHLQIDSPPRHRLF